MFNEKGKDGKRKVFLTATTAAMVLGLAACGSGSGVRNTEEAKSTESVQETAAANAAPDMDHVRSIQAYTDGTLYGTGLVEVEITYDDGVDLSKITPDSYVLEDRGSLNPEYGQILIDNVAVNGQVVTLKVSGASQATAANKLVYSGDAKEGNRERNAFGIYCTGDWYRDENGAIHYGKENSGEYLANETKMGYQARHSLELKLRHAGEPAEEAECLADEKGEYNSGSKWLRTVDRQFGEKGFKDLYDLKIPSTGADASDGTGDPYVQGYYYVPENYKPENGIIFTLQGQGISYWKLADGCDDKGTGIKYDTATTSWADTGAIVVNIHDRSTASHGGYEEKYDFVTDDVNVMKYFIDTYKITGNIAIQGNSRGTMASDAVIKALAGAKYNPAQQGAGWEGELTYELDKSVYDFDIDCYICQNGTFGGNIGNTGLPQFNDDAWEKVAATGLKVWAFDGEQDTNNIETVARYKEELKKAGRSDAWIEENVRLTGYTSDIFYAWGETDHSVTRMNGWYFDDQAYYGPDLTIDENGEIQYNTKLKDGDTYVLPARGKAADSSKKGYEYKIYDDLFHDWALIPAEQ
ncbi:hypothetical protein SAMN04487771_101531 [[Clostridium] aminophilum]|uniref:Esterase Ig-like N-terminal domain-containing protein n=1 Tax=[Clostridium] aminophilum TaxID=1526 RepID=A0A1I0DZF6_9FIRM|nr:hypothetical protein [[Clostridium] aminophilum]SET37689.1 hypothetical protein SAMN04487771_101531 [[Clostridium] aminophilum]